MIFFALDGMYRFKQPIKVNWAYTSKEREATTGINDFKFYPVHCG